ncbi:DUF4190 domain-containing protein [Streptomyces longwoodensis]|uniref:DUF4190 domain-containing protein n=1 Tax=Streptomyces longwoodensis TaxID=68231 RepID=UPI0030E39DE0
MSIPPPPGPHEPQDPFRAPQAPSSPGAQPPGGPYGPYPQGPYGAPYPGWGQGYTPYNRQAPVNGVAIAALVLGVMCFLPAVGLVLGIVALVQIRRKGERGKPLAIVGAVLSSLGLALWIVSLSTGAASAVWDGFKEGLSGNASLSLEKGDCFDVPGGDFDSEVYDVDTVPCSGVHDAEVFAVVPVTGDTYPGDSKVADLAEDRCWDLQTAYATDPWALPDTISVYYLTPTSDTWEFGDREITCTFADEDGSGALTASLRADASTLDADQLAFLHAMNALDEVLYQEPDDYAEEDLGTNQGWAQDVHEALGTQVTALRAHTWPAAAQAPVAALVKDMKAAQKEWGKAAAADDADAYYEHYDAGYEYVDGDTTVAARRALGLATTPPTYDDGSGDGSRDGSGDGSEDGGSGSDAGGEGASV